MLPAGAGALPTTLVYSSVRALRIFICILPYFVATSVMVGVWAPLLMVTVPVCLR